MDDKELDERFQKWIGNLSINNLIRENNLVDILFNYLINFPEHAFIDKINDEKISENIGQYYPFLSKNLSLYIKYDIDEVSLVGSYLFEKEFGGNAGYSHGAGIGFILYIIYLIFIKALKLKDYVIESKKLRFFHKIDIFSKKIIISTLKDHNKSKFLISNQIIDHNSKVCCSFEVEHRYIYNNNPKF